MHVMFMFVCMCVSGGRISGVRVVGVLVRVVVIILGIGTLGLAVVVDVVVLDGDRGRPARRAGCAGAGGLDDLGGRWRSNGVS